MRIGKSVERSTWHLMITKKYEMWEEELSLWIHRLYQTGIPDLFMTKTDFMKNNPNFYSRNENNEKMIIAIFHLKGPFLLFCIVIVGCIISHILEQTAYFAKAIMKKIKVDKYIDKKKRIKFKKFYQESFFNTRIRISIIYLMTFIVIYLLSDSTTNEFELDLIIGVGSQTSKSKTQYLRDLRNYKEGSLDYFSVLGLQKGKHHFLKCLETTVRQGVSASNRDSYHSKALPKSFAFNTQSSQGIVICGTNIDDRCEYVAYY